MEHNSEKREIRRSILRERDSLSPEARKKGDTLLTERILGHQWFYRSEYLLCYVSYGSEISTMEILTEALKTGKKVYVPKVLKDKDPEMAFFRIDLTFQGFYPEKGHLRIEALENLAPGYKGIPEPPGDAQRYIYTPDRAEQTLLLMPGVAFDQFRNRLGYGKGFYDRYLADKPVLQARTIAVGYRCQLREELPI